MPQRRIIEWLRSAVHTHPYRALTLVFLAGALLGYSVHFGNPHLYHNGALSVIRDYRHVTYSHIRSPLLASENGVILDRRVPALKRNIEAFINSEKQNKHITDAAVYFRDLSNGPWFEINGQEPHIPASLLKLPLMIGLLKADEENSDILSQELLFSPQDSAVVQQIKSGDPMVPGQYYTVDDLLRRMIINSDNDAVLLLDSYMSKEELSDVYVDLGLSPPVRDVTYWISVKDYASFFRILYNASYLSQGMSEKALDLLLQTAYDDGLAAGLPPDVELANKFGERSFEDSSDHELHDCGIVYVPKRPYLICVMTSGESYSTLTPVIKKISKMTYDAVTGE